MNYVTGAVERDHGDPHFFHADHWLSLPERNPARNRRLEPPGPVWETGAHADLPINPAGNMDLQALQQRRKQVLTVGVVIWVLLLLFTKSHWRIPRPLSARPSRASGCWPDPGVHPGAHLVHALHRRPQEARARHRGPLLGRAQPALRLHAASARPASARRPAASCSRSCSLPRAGRVPGRWRGGRKHSWPRRFREFAAYAARVPRFWPRLSLWQEADELRVGRAWCAAPFSMPACSCWRCPQPTWARGCSRLSGCPCSSHCRDATSSVACRIAGSIIACPALPGAGAPYGRCASVDCHAAGRDGMVPARRRRAAQVADRCLAVSQAPRLDPARRLPAGRAQAHGGAADLRRALDLADRERRRASGSPPTTTTTCGRRSCPRSPP